MVRLNKSKLSNTQLNKLSKQFTQLIASSKEDQTITVFDSLLGKEEKIMIIKRLAVIILLVEGKTLYSISRAVKVSPATAKKLKLDIERGKYDELLRVIGKNKKEYFSILETIDNILHLGGILPHYNGLDRYRF